MSRGGRGGARGGMLKGVSWEYDPTQTLDSKPTELFPEYNIPFASPATDSEKQAVRFYKDLRDQIHHGPLYTAAPPRDPANLPKVFGEEQQNELFEIAGKTDVDPFVGVPTYSMKYERKERAIPQLAARPFIPELFPAELRATLEGEDGAAARGALGRAVRKKLILARPEVAGLTGEERRRVLMEKLDHAAEEEEVGGGADGEEEEAEEEDYNYEDDEDEMGGDYDAEQYFDDGGEMGDDDDGGGGDDY